MKLELASFPVRDVRFGDRTGYDGGVLGISKDELIGLVSQDKRIAWAGVAVAFPGEQTRIVNVRDAVEPRAKISGPGCVFPGILGPIETVGEGRTHTLPGVAVIHSAEYEPSVITGTGAPTTSILDMWGPGAALTPLGSTINVVLTTRLVDGVTELDAHNAIQLAECRLAQRLAETTKDLDPEQVEVFELFDVDPSLPRVIYIVTCNTEVALAHSGVAYYGFHIRESLPTYVHPNEFIDGALTSDARKGHSSWPRTWSWMNQPVVLALMREHGKRLSFLGVIFQRTRFESEFGKQITAACTSQMARSMKANNAIITRISPSGNNLMDVMLTLQACEKKGIKTVFASPEAGESDGTGPALHFYVPEATAMVNTGNLNVEPRLPAPTRIIGCRDGRGVVMRPGTPPIDPRGELRFDTCTDITEGTDWFGGMYFTCAEY
ncbi:MAG: hypothetical protein HY675_19300 [Chloroflexi bacterium]|nr:hypothetical protein [Chloroflexota bacterium]